MLSYKTTPIWGKKKKTKRQANEIHWFYEGNIAFEITLLFSGCGCCISTDAVVTPRIINREPEDTTVIPQQVDSTPERPHFYTIC